MQYGRWPNSHAWQQQHSPSIYCGVPFQVLQVGGERLKGKEENPFASSENEQLASVLYR